MILRSFFRGLLFVVPIAATIYLLQWAFFTIDNMVDPERWFGVKVPGLGFALAVVLITAIGMLASNILTRWLMALVDKFFQKMPLTKMIYGAIKDLLDAFVGEKKKFDRPVIVSLGSVEAEMLGFITRDDLQWLGRPGSVAVYFPQSYNFAGSVLLFPRERVEPLKVVPSEVMQFIVSGGVSGKH